MTTPEPLPPTVSELLAPGKGFSSIQAKYPLTPSCGWRRSRLYSQPSQPSSSSSSSSSFLSRLWGWALGPTNVSSTDTDTDAQTEIDNPSASFYRIYEFFIVNSNTRFRNELEYFCRSHPSWAVSELPDPRTAAAASSTIRAHKKGNSNSSIMTTQDSLRYLILAILAELMCVAFNRRIGYGLPRDAPPIIQDFEEVQSRPKIYECPPAWAREVKEAMKPFVGNDKIFIPNQDGKIMDEDDDDVSEEFKKFGVIVQMPHIHFI